MRCLTIAWLVLLPHRIVTYLRKPKRLRHTDDDSMKPNPNSQYSYNQSYQNNGSNHWKQSSPSKHSRARNEIPRHNKPSHSIRGANIFADSGPFRFPRLIIPRSALTIRNPIRELIRGCGRKTVGRTARGAAYILAIELCARTSFTRGGSRAKEFSERRRVTRDFNAFAMLSAGTKVWF